MQAFWIFILVLAILALIYSVGFVFATILAFIFKNRVIKGSKSLAVLLKQKQENLNEILLATRTIEPNAIILKSYLYEDILKYKNELDQLDAVLLKDRLKIAENQLVKETEISLEIKNLVLKINDWVDGYNYWIKFLPYRPIFRLFKAKEIKHI